MDFQHAAKTYGRIIISEVYQPDEMKTIAPLVAGKFGGIAGGQKYIINGILFKFAIDSGNLFEGDELATYKFAGQDLLCLNAYSDITISLSKKTVKEEDSLGNLCFPLCCLIDYRGFRLIAVALLPIRGAKTLVYGSSTAGEEVVNKNPLAERLLKKCAQKLNLSEHYVAELDTLESKLLYCCADLEAHLGLDGRFYLLDYARAMPPQDPRVQQDNVKNRYLILKLRPEFVRQYKESLDPDAFSPFVRLPPPLNKVKEEPNLKLSRNNLMESRKRGERAVREATEDLINRHIPSIAKILPTLTQSLSLKERKIFMEEWLTTFIHFYGINLRWMGLLRNNIPDNLEDSQLWKLYLLVEMIARVLKHEINKNLRIKMKKIKSTGEQPYIKVVVKALNLFFGDGLTSLNFWKDVLPEMLKKQFPRIFENNEKEESSLRSDISKYTSTLSQQKKISGICILFSRLSELAGLSFRGSAFKQFSRNDNLYHVDNPFNVNDINSLDERIKRTEIIGHCQGVILKMQAIFSKHQGKYSTNLFRESLKYFQQSLQAVPRNQRTIRNVADVFSKLGYNKLASLFYETALKSEKLDPISLFKYAFFLRKIAREPDKAEEYYRKSHEAGHTISNMLSFASFLEERGKDEEALTLYRDSTVTFENNHEAHYKYAKFLHEKKIDYDIAEKHYEIAYKINEEYPDLLKSYGEFMRDVRMNNEKAKELFDCLEKLEKSSFRIFDTSYRLKEQIPQNQLDLNSN